MTYVELALIAASIILVLAGAGHTVFLYLAHRQIQRIREARNGTNRR